MKKIYLLLLPFALSQAQAQFNEDFEEGITARMSQKFQTGETTWIDFGLSAIGVAKPLSGTNSAVFFNGLATKAVSSSLEMPAMDLTGPGLVLKFKHLQKEKTKGYHNDLFVELSNDSGKSWIMLLECTRTSEEVQNESISLLRFKTSEASIIRFRALQAKVDLGYPVVLDDIEVTTDHSLFALEAGTADAQGNIVKVYPNPSHGAFTVSSIKSVSISVYDFSGNLVYSSADNTNRAKLDLSSFGKGTYVMKTNDGTTEETQKLVIN